MPGKWPLVSQARRGFTLVEVLVALLVMALLAGLAWQGLDGIVRARDGSQVVLDRSLRLNTVMTQWEQDLMAVQDIGVVPAIGFDGQSLRLTRRVEGGVALVVWALRGGKWQRWATAPVTRANEMSESWLRSQQLLGNEPGQLNVADASAWQVYFYRGNAWTNAQSTGDTAPLPRETAAVPGPAAAASEPGAAGGTAGAAAAGTTPAAAAAAAAASAPAGPALVREQLPAAVRLIINLAGGTLTRDVALGPGGQ
jgi:general secretion pathway protein J